MATHVIDPRRADLLAARAQSVTARRLGELFAQLNAWHAERRQYRATVAELSALPDAVLTDVGVLRGDIRTIARELARKGRSGR